MWPQGLVVLSSRDGIFNERTWLPNWGSATWLDISKGLPHDATTRPVSSTTENLLLMFHVLNRIQAAERRNEAFWTNSCFIVSSLEIRWPPFNLILLSSRWISISLKQISCIPKNTDCQGLTIDCSKRFPVVALHFFLLFEISATWAIFHSLNLSNVVVCHIYGKCFQENSAFKWLPSDNIWI